MQEFRLICYKSYVKEALVNAEAQKTWLERIGLTIEKTVKRTVQSDLISIRCKFDETYYQEAYKQVLAEGK